MATPKSDSGFGLLSDFGLDLGSEKDVRSALRNKRIGDAMQFVSPDQGNERPGTAQGFGMLGAAVGNAVGEKFGQKPELEEDKYGGLPVEIQSRLKTVDGTKKSFEVWQRQNPDAKQQDIQYKYQEILAEQAFANDLPDVGIPILRQLQDRRAAVQKRDAELEKLGYENTFDKETMQARINYEKFRSNKEGVIQFYPRNSTNPNEGLTGYYDGKGNVITEEDGQPKVYTSSQYTLDRPQWYPDYGGGSGGGAGKNMTPTEKGQVRALMYHAMDMNDARVAVLDLIDEAAKNDGGNPMGKIGALTSVANRFVGYAEQLATNLSPDGRKPTLEYEGGAKPWNVNSSAGRAEWAKDNAAWLRTNLPGLKAKGEYADRYIARITEMAYAKAMALEGGSTRSLSDNDFRNAIISIGGAINDPQALAAVLLNDSDLMHERVTNRMSTYSPEEVQAMVHAEGFTRYNTGRDKLIAFRKGERWKNASGATPGAGTISTTGRSVGGTPSARPAPATADADGWQTAPNGARVRVKQ